MKRSNLIMGSTLVAVLAIGITAFAKQHNAYQPAVEPDPALPVVTVYKNSTCGCCNEWVKHMQDNGFRVKAHDVGNMLEYKERAKLGAGMGSCHTAFVDGYAIEGHVPAWDVKRLLLEKPDVSGLTVPMMPVGTPGMEMPDNSKDPYQVISYKDGKQLGVFTDYPQGGNQESDGVYSSHP